MNELIRIANVRTLQVAPDERAFYVGRGRVPAGCEPARLGNPFVVGAQYARGEAVAAYLPYLREKCREQGAVSRMVLHLAGLLKAGQRVVLVCWCAPAPCHAEVIRTAVLAYARR